MRFTNEDSPLDIRANMKRIMDAEAAAIQQVSVTDDFGQSFTGAFIYFVLKYFVSRGVTNDVCFPTDCEIRSCGEEN